MNAERRMQNAERPDATVRMTKKEAIVALCGMAQSANEEQLRAIALGCKALARAAIHKARNKAAQKKRGAEAAAPQDIPPKAVPENQEGGK